ncbi:hypothetical protein NL676_029363 [Syzygium grande]|nr:hypothetical protein NL676_029363 [Syzygium grande]
MDNHKHIRQSNKPSWLTEMESKRLPSWLTRRQRGLGSRWWWAARDVGGRGKLCPRRATTAGTDERCGRSRAWRGVKR